MTPGALQPALLPAPRVISIGEFYLGSRPERLIIYGLGSCVAVLLHDPVLQASCLGHVLLPQPTAGRTQEPSGRFASTAIPQMLDLLCRGGGHRERIVAKVVGGSQMFRYERSAPAPGIGSRNVGAVLQELDRLRIPLAARDTAGTHGRTVLVDAGSGTMEIRALRVSVRLL